jgi:23S rRNA (cytosine1962-C5)-methyltransferase
MFSPKVYQLLDFGQGRRLERFGPLVLDRPCPGAEEVPQSQPELWPQADACFERIGASEGRWHSRRELPERWTVAHDRLVFELKRTEFGHLGLFPEQACNWDWLAQRLAAGPRPLKVLNLFAYTGGSTLAAAAAGAEVVHVDAARNVVAWARQNAVLSGLADSPIRWIADDAVKFVRRELKRESRYDAVILDPPSYGHGSRGEVWRLSQHLPRLLEMCRELTAGRRQFVLLSCHTPGFGPDRLKDLLAEALDDATPGTVTAEELILSTATGRTLASGVVACWQSET